MWSDLRVFILFFLWWIQWLLNVPLPVIFSSDVYISISVGYNLLLSHSSSALTFFVKGELERNLGLPPELFLSWTSEEEQEENLNALNFVKQVFYKLIKKRKCICFLFLARNIVNKTKATNPDFRIKVFTLWRNIFYNLDIFLSEHYSLSESKAWILVSDSAEALTSNPYCKQISLNVITAYQLWKRCLQSQLAWS